MGIGFTGTRAGMTEQQMSALGLYLDMFRFKFGSLFIHGAAEGADLQAWGIAEALGYIQRPMPAGADPLARNRIIVKQSEFMLATPREYREIPRSGTWATIRYSRKSRTPGVIIWSDGTSSPITATEHPYMWRQDASDCKDRWQ